IFTGNSDGNSIVKNTFTSPIVTDTIKLIPIAWNGRIALRIELYGCDMWNT
ncbi:hypothetical protein QZH41_014476, partial [Actinostola sp. cb2023]